MCCFLSVFCDYGDAPAYFVSQLDSYVVPRAGCLYGNAVEQVIVAYLSRLLLLLSSSLLLSSLLLF